MQATSELELEAATPKPSPPWPGCEMLKAANCSLNANCSLCATPAGKEMCFSADIAAKLPPCEFSLSRLLCLGHVGGG